MYAQLNSWPSFLAKTEATNHVERKNNKLLRLQTIKDVFVRLILFQRTQGVLHFVITLFLLVMSKKQKLDHHQDNSIPSTSATSTQKRIRQSSLLDIGKSKKTKSIDLSLSNGNDAIVFYCIVCVFCRPIGHFVFYSPRVI